MLYKQKCWFIKPSIKFFGHINSEAIRTDPDKIRSIIEFSVLKNIKDLRAFLELATYYCKLLSAYAKTTTPFLQFLQKGVK